MSAPPDHGAERAGRIALLASFSGNGGVERMLVNLLLAFHHRAVAVDLLLMRAESAYLAELPPSIRQHQLAGRHAALAIPALARYLRRQHPRALLVAKDRAGRSAVIARALSGTQTPILLRLGTHLSTAMADRFRAERWLRYALIRWLYPHIDLVVAVSDGVAADVRKLSGLPPERVGVIRNPVITPALAQRAAQPCAHPWFATPPQSPEHIPVILGMGRLQRQKDFPTLIRAFARLHQQRTCRMMILGEGGARERLEQLTRDLGIQEAVAMPGFLPNPYPILARVDLFVLSSAWEGSPNVLTEALALGTPVVATDCPSGPAEILDRGRYGALVPVGDEQALAAAMAATLDHPKPAEELQAAAAEYRSERSAQAYLEALRRISQTPKAGRQSLGGRLR